MNLVFIDSDLQERFSVEYVVTKYPYIAVLSREVGSYLQIPGSSG